MLKEFDRAHVGFADHGATAKLNITDTWPPTAQCENTMQRFGLASFVSGVDLYLLLASPFHVRGPL